MNGIFNLSDCEDSMDKTVRILVISMLLFITVACCGLIGGGALDAYCRVTGNCKQDQIRAKADITISSAPNN